MIQLLALAAMSGFTTALSAPGPGLWPLAFFSLIPWAVATERAQTNWRRFLVDYIWGVVFFGTIVYYLLFITVLAYIPEVIIAPLFIVAAGFVYRNLRKILPAAVALPLAWIAGEVLRTMHPFNYPWDLLGYSAAGWLDFAGVASIGGVFLLTFLFAFVSGTFVDFLRITTKKRWIGVIISILLIGGAALLGAKLRRNVGEIREGPKIACIQPNVEQALKENSESFKEVWFRILDFVEIAAKQNADIITIPETMLPVPVVRNLPADLAFDDSTTVQTFHDIEKIHLQQLRNAAGREPWILTGALLYDTKPARGGLPRPKNSVFLFDNNNKEVGRYDKIFMVPGGEAIPFIPEGAFADWIRDTLNPFTYGMVPDLLRGEKTQVFEYQYPKTGGTVESVGTVRNERVKFGVSICYDNVFTIPFREPARDGADFHIVLSNEGWFPNESWEMEAMLGFSAIRAIETARSIVRCTNTGITCMVGPSGNLAKEFIQNEKRAGFAGVFFVRPPLCNARTFYVVIGDRPFYFTAAAAALIAIILAVWRRTSKPLG